MTDSINHSFSVPFVHRLRFTRDVFSADQDALLELLQPSGERPARVQFWLDEHVATARPELRQRIRAFSDVHEEDFTRVGNIQIAIGGEGVKNDIHILERMLKVFYAAKLDRRSYVVVIGGGAVLDAVGFAAAIAHRGIRLVRLPTTTLAQADSGIGVKNSVNLFGKKNWLGSFAVPWGVINDQHLLKSLSDRDFICGFSEAVKVSLLKDPDMFQLICENASAISNREMDIATPIIRSSAQWHLEHITRGGDPFEMLEARPLDFGHWSAHKMETMSDFSIRHGEAVAIGVAIDAIYSSLALGFPADDASAVLQCLSQLGFSFHPLVNLDTEILFAGMEEFRQHLGGRLTLTMLNQIGAPLEIHDVDRGIMRQAIDRVLNFSMASDPSVD